MCLLLIYHVLTYVWYLLFKYKVMGIALEYNDSSISNIQNESKYTHQHWSNSSLPKTAAHHIIMWALSTYVRVRGLLV